MKNISNLWSGVKNYIYKHYGQESGKMLVHAGLITWATACLSQVVAVVVNDKIPKEQKKFLIPQELADGALNILAFYLITNSAKNIAGKLVSTGKWSTKAVRDFVAKNPLPDNLKMGDMSLNLGKVFKENEGFHKTYDNFKGGMDMLSTVTGAVISSNLITPFIRNEWGAKRQKESITRDKMNANTTISAPNTLNMNTYLINRGSMKV